MNPSCIVLSSDEEPEIVEVQQNHVNQKSVQWKSISKPRILKKIVSPSPKTTVQCNPLRAQPQPLVSVWVPPKQSSHPNPSGISCSKVQPKIVPVHLGQITNGLTNCMVVQSNHPPGVGQKNIGSEQNNRLIGVRIPQNNSSPNLKGQPTRIQPSSSLLLNVSKNGCVNVSKSIRNNTNNIQTLGQSQSVPRITEVTTLQPPLSIIPKFVSSELQHSKALSDNTQISIKSNESEVVVLTPQKKCRKIGEILKTTKKNELEPMSSQHPTSQYMERAQTPTLDVKSPIAVCSSKATNSQLVPQVKLVNVDRILSEGSSMVSVVPMRTEIVPVPGTSKTSTVKFVVVPEVASLPQEMSTASPGSTTSATSAHTTRPINATVRTSTPRSSTTPNFLTSSGSASLFTSTPIQPVRPDFSVGKKGVSTLQLSSSKAKTPAKPGQPEKEATKSQPPKKNEESQKPAQDELRTEVLFQKLLDICKELDKSDDMDMVHKKLWLHHSKADKKYLTGQEFRKLLEKEMKKCSLAKEKKEKHDPYVSMKHVLEAMKANPHLGTSKLKKLQKMLKKVQSKIMQLEKSEVTSSGEEEDAYVQMDRWTKRAVQIYSKICELIDRPADAERQFLRKVSFSGSGQYQVVCRALERYYNKSRIFPDFQDVKKLVEVVVKKENLNVTTGAMHTMAEKIFLEFGTMLQRRRCYDDYSIMVEHLNEEEAHDPALDDPELERKLNENKRLYHRNENKVLEEYTNKEMESKVSQTTDEVKTSMEKNNLNRSDSEDESSQDSVEEEEEEEEEEEDENGELVVETTGDEPTPEKDDSSRESIKRLASEDINNLVKRQKLETEVIVLQETTGIESERNLNNEPELEIKTVVKMDLNVKTDKKPIQKNVKYKEENTMEVQERPEQGLETKFVEVELIKCESKAKKTQVVESKESDDVIICEPFREKMAQDEDPVVVVDEEESKCNRNIISTPTIDLVANSPEATGNCDVIKFKNNLGHNDSSNLSQDDDVSIVETPVTPLQSVSSRSGHGDDDCRTRPQEESTPTRTQIIVEGRHPVVITERSTIFISRAAKIFKRFAPPPTSSSSLDGQDVITID